jgi:hypothetical protein
MPRAPRVDPPSGVGPPQLHRRPRGEVKGYPGNRVHSESVPSPSASRPCTRSAETHRGSSSPGCSRTMYSAYQSDQFSSYCPPFRSSCFPCATPARRSAAARSAAAGPTTPCSRVRDDSVTTRDRECCRFGGKRRRRQRSSGGSVMARTPRSSGQPVPGRRVPRQYNRRGRQRRR